MVRLIIIFSVSTLLAAILGIIGVAVCAMSLAKFGLMCFLVMLYASVQARVAQDS